LGLRDDSLSFGLVLKVILISAFATGFLWAPIWIIVKHVLVKSKIPKDMRKEGWSLHRYKGEGFLYNILDRLLEDVFKD
jgi:hypothetical protein